MSRPGSALVVLAAFVIILFPSTASAHVTVSPGTAEPGGFARVVFRVPNERADASTTRLEVSFPADHRFGSVSVQPVPGWTATTSKEKPATPAESGEHASGEVVTGIVWEGGAIQPGQFQEFGVSMGRLPKTNTKLVFKAVQTYSSGEVVRWIDVQQDGGPRPEHPAPTLSVAAAPVAAAPAAPAAGTDTLGRVLGGAGLLAGLIALWLAVTARRRPIAPAESVAAQAEPTANEPVRI
ncbi:YcnI family copper-binding membrane protein [Lentzea terrae]|uniref:YcnI family copper-binding membrane protein n=1 Tax=Lentzea terrae TaxID=2200761 RepID=UPI0018E5380C|nr:YcnI family protein [Lentzea terrae]